MACAAAQASAGNPEARGQSPTNKDMSPAGLAPGGGASRLTSGAGILGPIAYASSRASDTPSLGTVKTDLRRFKI